MRGLRAGGYESFGKEPTKRRKQKADRREAAGTGRVRETEGKEGSDGTVPLTPFLTPPPPCPSLARGS